jgi:hypothetical protein
MHDCETAFGNIEAKLLINSENQVMTPAIDAFFSGKRRALLEYIVQCLGT